MVVFHVHHGFNVEPQLVAIEAQRGVEVANDNRDMVDLDDPQSLGKCGLELVHDSPATIWN